jgi:DNA repair exonuclease SbcCD nuclease subunit
MAKIAVISDNHAGIRNDSPIFHSYMSRSFEWFFQKIEEEKCEYIIHLGDLMDRRKYVNYLTCHRLRKDFLEVIEEKQIPAFIIAGNHDQYFKNTHKINALNELVSGRYTMIKTFDRPETITIDGLDIELIPWITEDNYVESMEAIKNTPAEILMGHLELKGFETFTGIFSDHGLDPSVFTRFDSVYSGHYHHRSSSNNISYIGAFAEYTWSDFNDPRGFSILDTQNREMTFHKNENTIFRMMAYDDVKHPDIFDKIKATDYSKYKDCYVKIVCVNKTNPYNFDYLLEKLYKAAPADISIVEDISAFIDNAESDVVNEAEDTQTILDKYISSLTLNVSNDKMKAFMKDIYNEAISLEYVEC